MYGEFDSTRFVDHSYFPRQQDLVKGRNKAGFRSANAQSGDDTKPNGYFETEQLEREDAKRSAGSDKAV